MKRFASTSAREAGIGRWSRRRFVEGVAAGGAITALGAWSWPRAARSAAPELAGNVFELTIGAHPVNVTGSPGIGTLVNASLPAPTLRWREGDTITVRVHNTLTEDTSIHWHGIVLPANMDGVPGLSFNGIAPGQTFEYRFDLRQSGTYWYHTHSGFQEQTGLYGALIIDPREADPFAYEREHVVLLSDWSDLEPARIYGLLKKQSDYFNYNKPTLAYFNRRVRELGLRAALDEQAAWGRMRMDPSDLADVSGHTYTYLMNGISPNGNWTGLFAPGERVRLRFINGAAMTYFDVRIPGLEMTVVAADGQNVHPVTVEEFRIGVAEVIDVIVRPAGGDAFTVFAQSMDRTGYARGTLAVREGLSAPVPALDRIVYLTMADMGHGAVGGEMSPAGQAAPAMPGMDHAAMGHVMPQAADAPATVDHSAHGAAAGGMQAHPSTELANPGVDMQTMAPAARLDDPGVGLRSNGRRVLTYADLRTLHGDPDGREPGRSVELHLTGHMGRYMWSFDGIRFSDAEPIRLEHGERVRLVLVNDTMMEHPIHLHGLWSDLESETGEFQLRKHTLSIPPGTRRSYRVTADALGRWAYHCHLLYHMEAGMFREIRVEPVGGLRR
ncbi:MAG TPA: copper resistance system multicopper oxidase [Gammaproteobacteria bacterium]|nr:copper resistance system multicopper oxidase [Gammaproteobacteria bacterium]